MNEILTVGLITLLAVISPGADFALVTRNSYLYGRNLGICTAYGIACGVWIHISYSLIGLIFLKSLLPDFIQLIQYIGAVYLIYIGYKTYTQTSVKLNDKQTNITSWQAFKHGFLTNSLNPKTTLFVMSIYSQIMTIENQLFTLLAYGIFISSSHLIWFCLITIFCSTPAIRHKILAKQLLLNRLIGMILSGLGLSLLFANL
ncbi:LysE family translocator [Acinetobacter haemolyticus]|uniref:LysE family translocator n=1 Tax=Acinetobacter haemolyticus TaxID=29430 RepID=UPI00030C01E9|nr:LysE family translocator [Acinetobacter haemolyticus]NAR50171.1 LysE family transporter [Acinetobacter haemolyticus]NAR55414.1 LysE family transporter [Acinetobacter haemolyticus]NAR59935.1 LysE family transporter [Acinetobacter haemolyticus]NAR66077.1 LysE family transporter [Acinetobacter haemolyticus]NAR69554.1 LysE family transporter [Acinetobacter haemolyticus]